MCSLVFAGGTVTRGIRDCRSDRELCLSESEMLAMLLFLAHGFGTVTISTLQPTLSWVTPQWWSFSFIRDT